MSLRTKGTKIEANTHSGNWFRSFSGGRGRIQKWSQVYLHLFGLPHYGHKPSRWRYLIEVKETDTDDTDAWEVIAAQTPNFGISEIGGQAYMIMKLWYKWLYRACGSRKDCHLVVYHPGAFLVLSEQRLPLTRYGAVTLKRMKRAIARTKGAFYFRLGDPYLGHDALMGMLAEKPSGKEAKMPNQEHSGEILQMMLAREYGRRNSGH